MGQVIRTGATQFQSSPSNFYVTLTKLLCLLLGKQKMAEATGNLTIYGSIYSLHHSNNTYNCLLENPIQFISYISGNSQALLLLLLSHRLLCTKSATETRRGDLDNLRKTNIAFSS